MVFRVVRIKPDPDTILQFRRTHHLCMQRFSGEADRNIAVTADRIGERRILVCKGLFVSVIHDHTGLSVIAEQQRRVILAHTHVKSCRYFRKKLLTEKNCTGTGVSKCFLIEIFVIAGHSDSGIEIQID